MKIRFAALAAASLLAFPAMGGVIPGFEINLGLDAFFHYYREPGLMRNYGPQLGAYGSVAYSGLPHLRPSFEAAWAGGDVTYDGAYSDGTPLKGDVGNSILVLRPLLGGVFDFSLAGLENIRVIPYTGFGYRRLFNNLEDLGRGGYTREQIYYYLPIGLEVWLPLTAVPKLNLGFRAEYDHLLRGRHKTGPIVGFRGDREKRFTQDSGWGLLLSPRARYDISEKLALTAEVYFQYWDIDDSSRVRRGIYYYWEPANTTSETGLRLGVMF